MTGQENGDLLIPVTALYRDDPMCSFDSSLKSERMVMAFLKLS